MQRDLNSLLGSRICHDLISPLGAIGNGVELLAMSGSAASPEISLIAESVENANARIRFFRIAFGLASAEQGLGASEIRILLKDVYKSSRLKVEWQVEDDSRRHEVKLALLLLLCLESAMPWGGRVTVRRDADRWAIAGAAERMSIAPEIWDVLRDPDADVELTSANVHFALAPETARSIGRPLSVETDTTTIRLGF